MIILISLLIVGSIGLIVLGVMDYSQFTARRPVLLNAEHKRPKVIKIKSLISWTVPLSRMIVEKLRLDEKIRNRLAAGNVKFSSGEFFSLKLITITVLSIITFFAVKKVEPIILVVVLAIGYILPDLWLKKKISQRKNSIARLLPETVDLLGLCVEAGLDFATATKWLIEKTPQSNPMVEELAFVLEEIKWGKPRSQALKDMSRRLNIPEVSSFVQTLVQAERMGTPVAEAFAILSEDTRMQRFHRGERYAMQAPIKILIPLVFCILPVIAIIIGGPIFLQFMQGNLFKGFGG
ncbi:MAG: type II secretion system F family protein [Candidatus Omnitrophota bacterium]